MKELCESLIVVVVTVVIAEVTNEILEPILGYRPVEVDFEKPKRSKSK